MSSSNPWRRGVIAAIIVLLLGGSGIAVVGTAAASDPGIVLPPRHAGDQVGYKVPSNMGAFTTTIEQLALFAWKDAQGRYHLADGIIEHRQSGTADFDLHSYLDTHGRPLVGTLGGSSASGYSQGLLGDRSSQEVRTSSLEPGASNHPCGFVNSLQGGASSAVLKTTCGEFRLVGREPSSDGDAHVFASGDARLWFRPGIPYPARIDDGSAVWEMTGFERGAGPLRPIDLPPATPMPDVVPQPRPREGLDMAGLDLDYPMDRAVAEAKADPTFTDLRDYLAGHPDARVVDAEYEGDEEGQRWHISWADDATSFRLLIQRAQSEPASIVHESLGMQETWDVEYHAIETSRGHERPLPTHAPALRDVVAAWQTYVESDEPPKVVGFHWPGSCECALQAYAGSVGSNSMTTSSTLEDLTGPSETTVEVGNTIHYDENGELHRIDITRRVDSRSGALSPPVAEPTGEAPAPAGWGPPPAQAAAGIGLGALTVGLLYWLWPAIKGVPAMGLAWRRRPSILGHPVRRRLHGIVCAQPGIHYQAIVKQTGIGKGATEHHLRGLVAAGELTCVRNDGYTCYFPKGTDHRAAAAAGAMKSEGARKVLDAIQARPGAAVTDIAAATGLSPGTVSHHLRRMRERGLVESWRDGKTVRLRAGAVALTA